MHIRTILLASLCLTAPASAATIDQILAANRAATGGDAWAGKAALKLTYHYEGQGLKGTTDTVYDLSTGRFVDTFNLGPAVGAQGFDGTDAWQKDPSGAVTLQNGSALPLAFNEAYRDANLWWRADHGGAAIALDDKKSDANADALSVTPKNGENFTAWFDRKSHLLVRVFEQQDAAPTTSTFSDYKSVDGAMLAGKILQSTGDAKYDQTQTLTTSTFLPAQADSVFAPPKVVIADTAMANGAHEITLPFQLVNNHIYAEVKVNGKGPYTFIFDTGGVNVVTPKLARELGLPIEGQMEARGAGSGTMDTGFTKVDKLELGGASIKNQSFAAFALDALSDVEGMDERGMIGFETFRRFVTRIDYGTHTLTLIDPKHFDAKDAGTAVPIVFDGNVPEVDATYDGIKGKFQLDTGARTSLTLTSPFVAKNDLRAHAGKGVEAVMGWGIGGATRAYAEHGGAFVLGGQTIDGAVVELATDKGGAMAIASLAGNIGAGILKRFVLTLDYEHNVIYLKPAAGPIADLDSFDRSGMWLNRDPKGFKIVDVTPGAPAENAGLKAGDVVVAIDGKDAMGSSLSDLRTRLRNDAVGTKVSLTVERAGAKETRVVVLRDLI